MVTRWVSRSWAPLRSHCAAQRTAEVLAERLATRTSNPYGKDPAELAETLEYLQTVEPLLRAAATLELVTTVPGARVADIVVGHVL
jgi:hypothetical protein